MNKELHDKLNSLNPVENNDNLSWDNVGDNILREVSNRKKKKRRKILFWWIGSLGLILFGSISYFSIVDLSKSPTTMESQNIPYSKDMRTATHKSPTVSNKSLKSKDSFNDPSRVVDINYPVSTETSRDLSTSQAMVKVTESSVQIIQSKTSREYDYLDTGNTNNTMTLPLNDTSYTEGLRSEGLLQNQNLIVANTEDEISITNPISTSREEIIIDYLEYKMALQVGISDLQIRSLPSDIILIDRARPNMQKHRITLFGGATLSDIQDHYTNASSLVGSFSGIDYNYLINRHLNISVGLQQEQYRFRTQFISTNPQLVYSPGTVETVYQLNGQPELTIETDSIPGVRIRRFSHYNTVNLTTIPLSVGTKKEIYNINLHAEVGIDFLIRQGSDGIISNSSLDLFPYEQAEWSFVRPHISVGMSYPLSQKFDINMDITSSQAAGDTKEGTSSNWMHRIGIGVGYRW